MKLPQATLTRLEKVANDSGFDQRRSAIGDWLAFASTQTPLELWLTTMPAGSFVAAVSQLKVQNELNEYQIPTALSLPQGACGAREASDIPTLHRLVRRAFQLSKALPDELLQAFQHQTAALPKSTEIERLVVHRVGQDIFRTGLLNYWDSRCAVTRLAVPELLRASHIKPWADCTADAERLDIFNGLLLAPHLDLAFDRGFITVADDGTLVLSESLSTQDRATLGLHVPLRVAGIAEGHRKYLPWHRDKIFRGKR
jgi:putative restriction endonuclease